MKPNRVVTDTRNVVFVVCYRHPKFSVREKFCGFWEPKILLIRSKLAKLRLIEVFAKSGLNSLIFRISGKFLFQKFSFFAPALKIQPVDGFQ